MKRKSSKKILLVVFFGGLCFQVVNLFVLHTPSWIDGVVSVGLLTLAGLILILSTQPAVKSKETKQVIKKNDEQLLALINAMQDFVCFKDDKGRWLTANECVLQFYHLEKVDYKGKTTSELASYTSAFTIEMINTCRESDEKAWNAGKRIRVEECTPQPDGTKKYYEVIKVPIFNNDKTRKGLVVIGRDITERKETEETIKQIAYYDSLTGLGNQRLLKHYLEQLLIRSKSNIHPFSIICMDLHRFKYINDMLGYDTGDLLLREVASRLKKMIGDIGFVSRHCGANFMVVLSHSNVFEAAMMAKQIFECISQPFLIQEQEYHITPSFGISCFPEHSDKADTLTHCAELAMYRANEHGNDRIQLFSNEMSNDYARRNLLEQDLYKALERDEFVLHYQPQINVKTGKVVGMEALVRWQHPVHGVIPPNDFIPIAEESGLIIPLGELILRKACEQTQTWVNAGYSPIRIGVNLSVHQFKQQDLVNVVHCILRDTGLDPQYLELEITESVALLHVDSVIEKLTALKGLGVHISIDDFGTGYSSFSYLNKFPVDTLKIDRSFIQEMMNNQEGVSLTKGMIALSHSLNMKVIAEGVETEEQLDLLRGFHCDLAQGFLFSAPVLANVFESSVLKNLTFQRTERQLVMSSNET